MCHSSMQPSALKGGCKVDGTCYISGMEFIAQNWGELLIAVMLFTRTVVNMLPDSAEQPRKIFGYVDLLVDAIVANNKRKK